MGQLQRSWLSSTAASGGTHPSAWLHHPGPLPGGSRLAPWPPTTYPACGQHTRCTRWGSRWTRCLRRSSWLWGWEPGPTSAPPLSTHSPKGSRAGVALGCRLAGAGVVPGYEAEREGADLGCKEGRAGADPACGEDGVGPGHRGMGQGGTLECRRMVGRDTWVQRDGAGVVPDCRGMGQGRSLGAGCRGQGQPRCSQAVMPTPHLACGPCGSGSSAPRPPSRTAGGRRRCCRCRSRAASAPPARWPGSCPRAVAGR